MGSDPIDTIPGLMADDDTQNVDKPAARAELKAILRAFVTCADVRNRDLSGRTRIMAGSRFFRKDTFDTSVDDGTETTSTLIDSAGNHWLVIEGERYDIPFSSTGLLGDGEAFPAFAVVTPLIIPAGLPGSVAFAIDGAPTSDFTVTFKKSLDYGATWLTAFTATIPAGARIGAFALIADLSLPANALLRPYMPSPHDPTLLGFTSTIAALR